MITPLRITVRDLKASFASLVERAESRWASTRREGTTAELIGASNAVEKIIHNDLTWVADSRRRQAADVAPDHAPLRNRIPAHARPPTAEQHFLDEVKHFNSLFESVDGAPAMKQNG